MLMRCLFLVGMSTWAIAAPPADDKEAFAPPATEIGHHLALYDANGKILPWTNWEDAMAREMAFYYRCPDGSNGYPVFVYTTFMDGDYHPYKDDTIPCTVDGMGIISYLKYWEFKDKKDARALALARRMGDYLVNETLTPDEGAWPRFTRSTGWVMEFPIQRSSQHDALFGPNTVQPDKGGLAGYALVKLYEACGDERYLKQALHNAELLAKHLRKGDATHAPWPFRVDSITGEHWGERNANMVFCLRLFDELAELGHKEFKRPAAKLWRWIKDYQIPAPDDQQHSLWVQFFEDHHEEDNRVSWAPLETARYLIERREKLDPEWKADAVKLIQFVIDHLSTTRPSGVTLAVEQDYDKRAWGGVATKFGGVTALFYAAGGGEQYKEMAYRALNWGTYAIAEDGCPNDMAMTGRNKRGGWQEDAHTDVVLNYIDAMTAVPEWRGTGTKR